MDATVRFVTKTVMEMIHVLPKIPVSNYYEKSFKKGAKPSPFGRLCALYTWLFQLLSLLLYHRNSNTTRPAAHLPAHT